MCSAGSRCVLTYIALTSSGASQLFSEFSGEYCGGFVVHDPAASRSAYFLAYHDAGLRSGTHTATAGSADGPFYSTETEDDYVRCLIAACARRDKVGQISAASTAGAPLV